MSVLVAYASRHGSTRDIAEHVAERLRLGGVPAEARPVREVRDPASYDAFVVGSAAYMFHWLGEATAFVRRNRDVLAAHPVWLFSSGPLGPDAPDAEGRDPRTTCTPREWREIAPAVGARDTRVFFGAFASGTKPSGFMERLTFMLPAARKAFTYGDFRNWPEIDAWTDGIARELVV